MVIEVMEVGVGTGFAGFGLGWVVNLMVAEVVTGFRIDWEVDLMAEVQLAWVERFE